MANRTHASHYRKIRHRYPLAPFPALRTTLEQARTNHLQRIWREMMATLTNRTRFAHSQMLQGRGQLNVGGTQLNRFRMTVVKALTVHLDALLPFFLIKGVVCGFTFSGSGCGRTPCRRKELDKHASVQRQRSGLRLIVVVSWVSKEFHYR